MILEGEIHLQGAPLSEGIAIGSLFFLPISPELPISDLSLVKGETEEEISRYRRALLSSREDLRRLQRELADEGYSEPIRILESHLQMLEDPFMTTHMEERIREMGQNTVVVFREVINEYEKRFSQTRDAFFQQRLVDILDLSKRILSHLCFKEKTSLKDVPLNSIVVSRELVPSHTAAIQNSQAMAFVTQIGGGNSHAALIARAKSIPYVAGIDVQLLQPFQDKQMVVDGFTGNIIVDPTHSTLLKYKDLKDKFKRRSRFLLQESPMQAETTDGFPVDVLVNIGSFNDLDFLKAQNGALGVGLFRSEYLFLQSSGFFASEEEQYRAYLQLIERAWDSPVTIRVFDLGGDKHPHLFLPTEKETNPILGCRGIRFLLSHKEIFKTQLRAILRATPGSKARILLPMISDVNELREAKKLIQEVKIELGEQGFAFAENLSLGVMIEVPSAVFVCDALVRECDFLSIGTNDLAQYTLGVDRTNPVVHSYYYALHPSVVRMIKMIILAARNCNKPVSLCGEVASQPLFIPLLMGLGIREFSCAPRYISVVKRMIRKCSFIESYEVAQRVLGLSDPFEISTLLFQTYQGVISEEDLQLSLLSRE